MNVIINTIPEKKEDLEINNKIKEMILDRSRVIASKLKTEMLDVEVNLYFDTHKLVSKVGMTTDERLGVFSGYVDYENSIHIAHPTGIEPIFSDNLWKQMGIMIDYTLYKYYLCKIYFNEPSKYKLYYKYLTNGIAKLLSGNYNRESIIHEIRTYSDLKKYKKDSEINMVLFVILEKSDISMLYDNIARFYEDSDIKKSIMRVYKKEFKELIGLYQKELIVIDKDLKKVK